MNTTELKPCPFCGEKAKIIGSSTFLYEVRCGNTDCRANIPLQFTEKEAMEKWNGRTDNE